MNSARVRARWLIVSASIPIGLIAVLAVEAMVARRVERLPPFPLDALSGRVGAGVKGLTRLLWLGDSTGDGVGASAPDRSLPRQVAAGLNGPVDLVVLAASGARVRDVLETQLPAAERLNEQPHIVVVCVGGNDVTHLSRRSQFRRDLSAVLDEVRQLKPSAIVVVGIGEFAATPLLAQPLRFVAGKRADMLARDQRDIAAAKGAVFVDIIAATGKAFASDPRRYHARDGFHPSDDGYRLWSDAILATMTRTGLTPMPK